MVAYFFALPACHFPQRLAPYSMHAGVRSSDEESGMDAHGSVENAGEPCVAKIG